MVKTIELKIEELRKIFKREKSLLLFCLATGLGWGLAAHAFGFLNGNFSHDALNAFYATAIEDTWKVELGRFLVPIYRKLTRGAVALPWLIGIIALIYIGISAYLGVKMFRVKSKIAVALICGVMSTNITVTAMTATYLYELDVDMLALLLAVGAVYLWYTDISNFKKIVGGGVMLAASIGLYQSYMAVALSLMILSSIVALLDGGSSKQIILRGVNGIVILAAGGVLYYVLCTIALSIVGVTLQERTNVFAHSGTSLLSFCYDLLKRCKNTYVDFFQRLRCYSLVSVFPEKFMLAVDLVVAVTILFIVFYTLHRNSKMRPSEKLLACGLIMITPLGINITYFLSRGFMHDLMTYSYWMVFVIFVILVFNFANKNDIKYSSILKGISIFAVGILLWSNIVIANTAYIKKDLEQKAELSLMTRVVAMMESQEDYSVGETQVAFIGVSRLNETIPGFTRVKNIIGLVDNTPIPQDTSKYYYNVYKAYFEYILNYPINICNDDTHRTIKETLEVQDMPTFPNDGSIRMIDGVMVVKMGQ